MALTGRKPGQKAPPKRQSEKDQVAADTPDLKPTASDENFEHVLRRLVIERDGLKSSVR
jgi:hypothetical protein